MRILISCALLLVSLTACTPSAAPTFSGEIELTTDTDSTTIVSSEVESFKPVDITKPFEGKLIKVLDGDTIDVLTDDKQTVRIRLEGIDAPERGQPFGKQAKEFISGWFTEEKLIVNPTGTDRYGRTLASVTGVVQPFLSVNEEILVFGLAWHYKQYNDDEWLADMEKVAREKKRGLWADARSVPPWEWRKLSKDERDKLR